MNREKAALDRDMFYKRNAMANAGRKPTEDQKKYLSDVLRNQLNDMSLDQKRQALGINVHAPHNVLEPGQKKAVDADMASSKLIYDVQKDPNKEFFKDDKVLSMTKELNDQNPYTKQIKEKIVTGKAAKVVSDRESKKLDRISEQDGGESDEAAFDDRGLIDPTPSVSKKNNSPNLRSNAGGVSQVDSNKNKRQANNNEEFGEEFDDEFEDEYEDDEEEEETPPPSRTQNKGKKK